MTMLSEDWLATLDPHLQEILVLASQNLEDFSSNVRTADALALLAFRRAVDAANTPGAAEDLILRRLEFARRANATAARVKADRLDVLDRFENIADAPRPANVEFVIVQASPQQQIERLRAMGYEADAEAMAQRHGLPTTESTDEGE